MKKKLETVPRPEYLSQLIDFSNQDIIKVVTGIRRSGKSTLLELFVEHLKEQGVLDEQIIFVNFESARFEEITNSKALYKYVESHISPNCKTYIFLDEVQTVENFEKAVDSFTVDFDTDIYLTGSNAYMLASDLSTLLSGRYIEIKMYPLSFKEYMSAQTANKSPEDCFYDYMKYGGFPFITNEIDERKISMYLDGIYNTVIFKDIVQRNKIKDTALIEKLIRFVFSSIGSLVSATSIAKAIKDDKRGANHETIENYLDMLCRAHILSKAVRYDIKGKDYLKTLSKYYVTDLGLRNNLLGYRQVELTHALENIIYFELLRRGWQVDIGKIGDMEVDFMVRRKEDMRYYQVTWTVNNNPETLEREYRPFDAIPDHYEKIIITMDKDFINSINGVKKLNAIDFLLDKQL
ncbi:MAG: ATP-binding protein [Christensenellaceae bacterium]|jgi:predicted AAA+ superfamily ATPase|nr:ATP-binding protein [Christensenellaceae bacterium]